MAAEEKDNQTNKTENNVPSVQWFPGHMQKTRRLISENLKLVDVVIELLDARAPRSSGNPMLREIIGDKPKLIALNKSDLADPAITKMWQSHFKNEDILAVTIDSISGRGLKRLIENTEGLAKGRTDKLVAKGGKARAARAMVVGIPNVGKSSLINRLAGASKAKVENRPGVTRDKQWIKVGGGLDLLDVPGILWPKFDDPVVGLNLSFIGSIKDDVLDTEEIAQRLLEFLKNEYPVSLMERYKLTENETAGEAGLLIEKIGRKRGALRKGGVVDMEKAWHILITDFRNGNLGKISFEKP
ncbi:MAG: ribosome biogenesis GTPase YlqF [Schwartzia sp.]|nr:ribosome biogenesis GTPase YlqF [Schwartzia sp. (in: firmicutes)]